MSLRKGKEKVRPKSKKNLSTLPFSLDPPPARMPPDGSSLSIHMFMPTPNIVPHTQSHPSMVPPTHSSPIQSPTDMAPPPIHSLPSRMPYTQSPTSMGPSIHHTITMVSSPQLQPTISLTHHMPMGTPSLSSHLSYHAHGFQSTSTETTSTTIGTSYQRIQLGPDENIIPMPGGT